MVRIGGDGFTEIAAMESPPGAAFQIAVFANGDRIESCYIFETITLVVTLFEVANHIVLVFVIPPAVKGKRDTSPACEL